MSVSNHSLNVEFKGFFFVCFFLDGYHLLTMCNQTTLFQREEVVWCVSWSTCSLLFLLNFGFDVSEVWRGSAMRLTQGFIRCGPAISSDLPLPSSYHPYHCSYEVNEWCLSVSIMCLGLYPTFMRVSGLTKAAKRSFYSILFLFLELVTSGKHIMLVDSSLRGVW